jgi:hypothetical protein
MILHLGCRSMPIVLIQKAKEDLEVDGIVIVEV